ncbi:hypothetical protein [Thalassospira mesophila]|uniref:hypothetical protein n=1 Tax=Thalassospira mesophila TaxID=1293891 RepID=UPI000A1FF888|nr:hypothetical protein [Thalassospira mesophila]
MLRLVGNGPAHSLHNSRYAKKIPPVSSPEHPVTTTPRNPEVKSKKILLFWNDFRVRLNLVPHHNTIFFLYKKYATTRSQIALFSTLAIATWYQINFQPDQKGYAFCNSKVNSG